MTSLFESLTPKLANVIETATQDQGPLTPQSKQALVRSTKDFKDSLREANEFASTLPGGELSIEEQDEIIGMLEKLKDRKRRQLAEFADKLGSISSSDDPADLRMEVDSTASTPA
ncbi:uncharacterized protein BXZ73DRAFT_48789 [Epithele typhae]|uniref:uncharacterized protein n=1 Tax=Epithele typhae TaxID=378194 RepID=UPI0020073E84|nr:uncharacterized protein BXZ73DRAFT_48789 [Epithele typhae]KAH9927447.1 hypothetical protein BXZ73DRAFT_48789 [Epithele typhae]